MADCMHTFVFYCPVWQHSTVEHHYDMMSDPAEQVRIGAVARKRLITSNHIHTYHST